MRILLINNDGEGVSDRHEIPEGTSLQALVSEHSNGRRADDFHVRVNRNSVSMEYVLQDGDRVTMTPTKIEGA